MIDKLFHDPELAQFYDLENGWSDDSEFCFRQAETAGSVLDLGCGTGMLAASLAADRHVVGVDPAFAMLDIACKRPGGGLVQWVEADARHVRLGRTFDLIFMTGHAFQCLLTDEDQVAVLRTIAAHLAPGGSFVFDSRNPNRKEWLELVPERSVRNIVHPTIGTVEVWNNVAYDTNTKIATYKTYYRAQNSGQLWEASSKIRFASKPELASQISAAGLRIQRWLGDYTETVMVAPGVWAGLNGKRRDLPGNSRG